MAIEENPRFHGALASLVTQLNKNWNLMAVKVNSIASGGGIAEAPIDGTTYGRNNATWVATGSGGVTDGDKGDITVTSSGAVWSIDTGVVTLAKMANVATGTLFYRKTAGAGVPEVQTLATLKTDLGLTGTNSGDQTTIVGITGTLAEFNAALTGADFSTGGGTATGTNTGDQTLAGLGGQPLDADLTAIAGLVDPNADRILFWDDSASTYAYLGLGTNLSITDTTLDAAGGGGGVSAAQLATAMFLNTPFL